MNQNFEKCGLFAPSGLRFPLKSVNVNVTVLQDFCCQVSVIQEFQIEGSKPILNPGFNPSHCTIGHALTEFQTTEWTQCAGCQQSMPSFSMMFECKSCQYFLCGNCHIPIRKNKQNCPQNHGLTKQVVNANKRVCDVCDVKVPAGSTFHCATCFYDVCPNCYQPDAPEEPIIPKKNVYQASYYFPVDGNAAVYDFKATFENGTVVKGDVRPKQKAKMMYEQARDSGKTAFLMEREASDIFQMTVGNVNEDEVVIIQIDYIAELEMDGGLIRLRIPNRIAPKCGGGPETTVTYPMQFDFAIRTGSPISGVEVKGGYNMVINPSEIDDHLTRLSCSTNGYMNEDMVLLISQQNPYGVFTTFERSLELQSECLRVTFNNQDIPTEAAVNMRSECDVVFIVDKSGSMSGSRIKTVKQALTLFLRSLPMGSRFNVVSFNKSYDSAFVRSVAYTDENVAIAQRYVDSMKARGGTNIYNPLNFVLSQPEDSDYKRRIILLTDGEVSNTAQCMERAQTGCCRIFTIGVGESFSQDLVEGLATCSGGTWEAVRDSNDLGNKVMRTLGCVIRPVITRCNVDLGPFGQTAVQWPTTIPEIYDGKRTTMYWIRPFTQVDLPQTFPINITGQYESGAPLSLKLKVVTSTGEGVSESEMGRTRESWDMLVHRVAAMQRIKKLETSAGNFKSAIRELGMKYNLASSETSFVAIRHEVKQNALNDLMVADVPPRNEPQPKFPVGSPPPINNLNQMPVPAAIPLRGGLDPIPTGFMPMFHAPAPVFQQSSARIPLSLGGPHMGAPHMRMQRPPNAVDNRARKPTNKVRKMKKYKQKEMGRGHRHQTSAKSYEKPRQQQRADYLMDIVPEMSHRMLSGPVPESDTAHRDLVPLSEMQQMDEEEIENEMLEVSQSDESCEEQVVVKKRVAGEVDQNKRSTPTFDLNWLVMQQSVSGMFRFNLDDSKFAQYESGIKNCRQRLESVQDVDNVIATILALFILDQHFAARKNEWTFVHRKASGWLKLKNIDPSFEELITLFSA